MKTPFRITPEEANHNKDEWMKEFVSHGDDGHPHCKKCGARLCSVVAFLSVHVAEFKHCAGPGMVERHSIPFCPECEPEPSEYGCLHITVMDS